jgi:hypothetical protein
VPKNATSATAPTNATTVGFTLFGGQLVHISGSNYESKF